MSPKNKGDSGDDFVQEHNESRLDSLSAEELGRAILRTMTELWCCCGKKPFYYPPGTPPFPFFCSANCILFHITGERFQQVSKAMEERITNMVTSTGTGNMFSIQVDRTGELPKLTRFSYSVGGSADQASQGALASSGNINPENQLQQAPEPGNSNQESVEQKQ